MDDKDWAKFKGDARIICGIMQPLLQKEIPYFDRLGKDVLGEKKLDKDYQSKARKLISKAFVANMPKSPLLSPEDLERSMSRSLDAIIDTVNSITVEDPVGFEKEHFLPLEDENMRKYNIQFSQSLRNIFDIMQHCRPGTALDSLKVSFQDTFEQLYLPTNRFIRDLLEPCFPKDEAYRLSEEIMCYERTVTHDGNVKSDIREIRNLFEHEYDRKPEYLSIKFQNGDEMRMTEDDMFVLIISTGMKSMVLQMIFNFFLILRLYELALPCAGIQIQAID